MARDGAVVRNDLWRLSPDGTIVGNYRTHRQVPRGSYYSESGEITGRWWVQADRLCVEGAGFEAAGPLCFDMVAKTGKEYRATNVDTGLTWQLFVYKG